MAKLNKKKIIEEKPDPVYLPVSFPRYKRNKILLLKTILVMLLCMKRIEKIRELKKEKDRMINELRKLLNFSHNETNSFDDDLPIIQNKSEMRKVRLTQRISFEREISFEEPSQIENFERFSSGQKLNSLDKELEEIKSALARLGGSEQ